MDRTGQVLIDHYRCSEEFVKVEVCGDLSQKAGFFRFGPESVCYGRCSAFVPSLNPTSILNDAWDYVRTDQGRVSLPFDLIETVSALQRERYVRPENGGAKSGGFSKLTYAGYYAIRPWMPVSVRKYLQRYFLRDWTKRAFPRWPVDTTIETVLESVMSLNLRAQGKKMPFIWFWPDGAQACAVITHDVETTAGRDFCDQLMDIDDSYGIKTSFHLIPEYRYAVPDSYLKKITGRGFEINVHDLNHDGKLFRNYEEYRRRSALINMYKGKFGAKGFRAGALYRNADWLGLLDFEYDMSVPNVAHLDPQHGGCCTTFPYFIGRILEIPVTMTQDYSLFNILSSYSLDLWEKQMSVIREKHGMMNFIVHPDYILREREQRVYRDLLHYLSELRKAGQAWVAMPSELNKWWRQRNQMKLVRENNHWRIVGEGKEHARIAYAKLENDKLQYTF